MNFENFQFTVQWIFTRKNTILSHSHNLLQYQFLQSFLCQIVNGDYQKMFIQILQLTTDNKVIPNFINFLQIFSEKTF